MKSSIEIAQSVELRHMRQYMADLALPEDEFEFYGKFTGKIRLELLDRLADRPDGKLILVTAMTPTKYGEGKTSTSTTRGRFWGCSRASHRSKVVASESRRRRARGDAPADRAGDTGG